MKKIKSNEPDLSSLANDSGQINSLEALGTLMRAANGAVLTPDQIEALKGEESVVGEENTVEGDGTGEALPPIEENVTGGETVNDSEEIMESDQTVSGSDNDNSVDSDTESNDVIDNAEIPADTKEVEPIDNRIILSKATPLGISEKQGEKSVMLLFLCKTTLNQLFILKRAIGIESDEDAHVIISNPLYDNNNFINQKATEALLISTLPSYLTDLDFNVDTDYTYNKKTLVSTDFYGEDGNMINVYMPVDVFGAIAYTEYNVFCGLNNNHALTKSIISALEPAEEMGFFVVEEIEEIVSMAQVEVANPKKKLFGKKQQLGNTIALVAKVSRTVQAEDNHLVKEFAYLLFSVATQNSYNKSKFKGYTVSKLSEEFFGDNDQFVTDYMIDQIRMFNIDKEFMAIKGSSKNNDTFMFMFDSNMCKKIERLIEAY